MLGSDLGKVFYDLDPYLLDRDEIDITNKDAIFALFGKLKPDIIINAAAYTDVDGSEENRDLAMEVNGKAPGYLAEICKTIGAVFVHYSTDYVFSGDKEEGYSEDDVPGNSINFYGESKLAGERAIIKVGGSYYIIRTSWLFGPSHTKASPLVKTSGDKPERKKNFVETMLRLAKESSEIKVVNDQHGNPTYTLDLAQRTKNIVDSKEDFGIYHLANEPAVTWYEFAKEIIGDKAVPCTSDEFFHRSVALGEGRPRPARRPEYSTLINSKLPPMRSWKEALEDYLNRGRSQ